MRIFHFQQRIVDRTGEVLVPNDCYRSYRPKFRLFRTWGKKMAVVIDEAFFSSLVGLEPERHLSNAEIVLVYCEV